MTGRLAPPPPPPQRQVFLPTCPICGAPIHAIKRSEPSNARLVVGVLCVLCGGMLMMIDPLVALIGLTFVVAGSVFFVVGVTKQVPVWSCNNCGHTMKRST